jgi:uncharacterized membrane protein YeaQ/YmgE (transglycosylase-associated protein family)
VQVIQFLLLGLAVAVVARLAAHGRGRVAVRPGLLLGAAGSIAGGVLAWAFGVEGTARWVTAVVAAAVVLAAAEVAQAVRRRRAQ